MKRVISTEKTNELISELVNDHGPLVFHQSGGCCDGSAPMCFPRGEFKVGSRDVFLGEIGEQPFFIAEDQYSYWEHTQLIIDVVKGRGGMFSVEGPTGNRFLTRSRVFTEEEYTEHKSNPPAKASDLSEIEGLKTHKPSIRFD